MFRRIITFTRIIFTNKYINSFNPISDVLTPRMYEISSEFSPKFRIIWNVLHVNIRTVPHRFVKFDSLLIFHYEMKPGENWEENAFSNMFQEIINPWQRRREITLRAKVSHFHHYSSLDSNTKDGQMDSVSLYEWIEVTSWK